MDTNMSQQYPEVLIDERPQDCHTGTLFARPLGNIAIPQAKEIIMMLGNKDATANIAVKNLETARKFYQDKLGLKQLDAEGQEVVVFQSGRSKINVYRSEYAGTNKATAVTWDVDDLEGTVQALKAKGIAFEHYDMPGLTREGDIHRGGNMKVAWFKDPDGNILNVISG
jgi:catechol 2,3-dioxygenase-like lactoylglutathione lyase family enzyme